MKCPVISIGMPVYNGEKDLHRVFDSLSQQTYKDIELIVSDNASTDATEQICREYASRDNRIRYIRQPENLGAVGNFRYVLNEACGEYFMWAASDDVRSPDFLELNHSFLEKNPDYVASTCPVKFEGQKFNAVRMGDSSLTDGLADRIEKYLRSWHANGRFYSLMRTRLLRPCPYVGKDFFGSDWAVVLYIITQGKTHRHEVGYVALGREGFSNSGRIFEHYRKSWIHWILPFYELNGVVLKISKRLPVLYQAKILKHMLVLNRAAFSAQIKTESRRKLKGIYFYFFRRQS